MSKFSAPQNCFAGAKLTKLVYLSSNLFKTVSGYTRLAGYDGKKKEVHNSCV